MGDHLSQTLQGEIWYQISQNQFSQLYYLQGSSTEFLIELSRTAHSAMFAPKESLNQPGTVYVIMSAGFVGCGGRLLSKNNYWGEDFILENHRLRKNHKAVAVTYVEVVFTTRDTLVEFLKSFSAEATEIRRAVVKLAVVRAVVRELRMQRLLKDSVNITPSYSLRLRRMTAFNLPQTELSAFGGKQDPFAVFRVGEVGASTAPVMDAGAKVSWSGEVLDFPRVSDEIMRTQMSVRVFNWERCVCKADKLGHECICHKLIGEGAIELEGLLSHQRKVVFVKVPLHRPGQKAQGVCCFEVYVQRLVNLELEEYKAAVRTR